MTTFAVRQTRHGLRAGAPAAQARFAAVLLHGRGASAEDILGLGAALALDDLALLVPRAPGNTWYPLSFLAPREANQPALTAALSAVNAAVSSLVEEGFAPHRIVLAGFSQGACLASEYVARHPARYGGLIAWTGGLVGPPGSVRREDYAAGEPLAGMPALLLSGDPDPHVPWSRVAETAAVLGALGASVQAHRFPARPHTVTPGEVHLARELLLAIASSPAER